MDDDDLPNKNIDDTEQPNDNKSLSTIGYKPLEWDLDQINSQIIYVDDSPLKATKDDIEKCFNNFYHSYASRNFFGTLQNLVMLRNYAQTHILFLKPNSMNVNIHMILVDLLIDSPIDLQKEVIRFMTELAKSPKQLFLTQIIKCSFFENIIHSATINFSDEFLVLDVLKFFDEGFPNFESIQIQVLAMNSLELFENIILNNNFSIKTREMPIQIINKISQLQLTQYKSLCQTLFKSQSDNSYFSYIYTKISFLLDQMSKIVDFIALLLKNKRLNNFWNDSLKIVKSMIIDEKTYHIVIKRIQNICLDLMMNGKCVAICTNSILIINFHFAYFTTPLQIFNKEDHFQRLLKFAKSKNNSLSRAALILIRNMMANTKDFFDLFLSKNIVQISFNKIDQDSKIKVKAEAVSILALIVDKGNLEQLILCIKTGFIHYFLEMASIDVEEIINTVIPPLLTLLDVGTKNPSYSFVWQLFDQDDGLQVLSDLIDSTSSVVVQNACYLEKTIMDMRNSLCK